MTINEIQDGIIEDFSVFEDWMDNVFTADSDAIITKGIASLLIKVMSNQTPEDILNADLYFIEKIGLTQHLSPTRSNGLLSMVKQIKIYALAYSKK